MRIIVESHFRAIFNIKPVATETAQSLKLVMNAMLQNIQALRALERPVDQWDDWVVYYLLSKLPYETRRQWELSLNNDKLPTLADLQTFLESRCRSLEVLAPSGIASVSKRVSNANVLHVAESNNRRSSRNAPSKPEACIYCSSQHRIYACSSFKQLSPSARVQVIKQKPACFNCLREDHKASNCKSTSNCLRCGRRHHTLLHGSTDNSSGSYASNAPAADASSHGQTSFVGSSPNKLANEKQDQLTNSPLTAGNEKRQNLSAFAALLPATNDDSMQQLKACSHKVNSDAVATSSVNMTANFADTDTPVLLATAMVNVQDCYGRWLPMRILFDNGSHASFVTEQCVQRLGVPRKASSISITGIGSTPGGKPKGQVLLTIASSESRATYAISVLVLAKITNDLPTTPVRIADWQHIKGLTLADPHYDTPGPIDILIGMDEMEHFLTTDLRKGPVGTPLAQRTTFGWVLFGRTENPNPSYKNALNKVTSLYCDVDLTQVLRKVWELDQVPQRKHLTDAERLCEDLFDSSHQRAPYGRFIVQLPFDTAVPIGETRSTAVRSLYRLEKRLAANEDLRQSYVEFMNELLQMGHMEIVCDKPASCYYMPHHAVLKETSETTKLRVVFNASMKSSSGFSLNDALLVGPQLQPELFCILLRFRMHRYAMTADIAKMYRQVYVHEKHVDFQRIVWRDTPTEELKDYRMLRLTYGTASASHLAVKALQQIGKVNMSEFQVSSKMILNDFYMDDLLTGADTSDELVLRQSEVSQLLSQGGFELRKWASNCKQLLDSIPTCATPLKHLIAEKGEVTTLGLTWNTLHDYLTYAVSIKPPPIKLTKRSFLSDASTVFDPLGLLSPCTIRERIWLQQIWRTDVDWDEPVPEPIAKDWYVHREELRLLSNLQLRRWLAMSQDASTEFHVFPDASEKAYAAVLYARTQYAGGRVVVNIVASKAKVAPLKSTTLPRLELCAAHLAAKLSKQVTDSLCVSGSRVFGWTDSTVTLAWLKSHPSRWTSFVANRVAEVQEILPPECWSHVRSENNPADCASRGMSASCLLSHDLWWRGPPTLLSSNYMELKHDQQDHKTHLELRKTAAAVNVAEPFHQWSLLEKYSSFFKLKRVTAYVIRIINNIICRIQAKPQTQVGPLTNNEIQEAEIRLISAKKSLPRPSSLIRLNPFVDTNGVLRVGGRIKHSNAATDVKYPVILGKNNTLAKLIILDIHKFTLHAGPRIMQVVLQRRFWVIGARNLIRKIYHSCVKCTCLNRNISTQTMADLPEARVTYARPFTRAAVDIAGPYLYKFTHGRGAKSVKGYICSFVCMSTGAMHLEFVGDLSTPAFLNAFKRFINRRGYCKTMFSDNGTNFVGAEKEMRKNLQQCMQNDKFRSFFNESSIEWHFNPPAAPHMGGYWEIGIKRIKYHLKRVLGDTLLSYEEFGTLLTEVEACVNSRPLCDNSTDVNDLEVLTPGHFLVTEPLKVIPEPERQDFRGNIYQRWQVISAIRQHFWRRWRDEYLVNLQHQSKWFRPSNNIEEGMSLLFTIKLRLQPNGL